MKKVVFNADDLGLSPEVNRAIIESFEKGVVRSCSLLVNVPYTEDGIALVKNTTLDVGLHLNLAIGKSLTDSRSLVKDGIFHGAYRFLIRYFLGMINIKEVEREIRAQIEMFQKMGFALNHIDSHWHLHCLPKIFDVVVKLAYEYDIKKIRMPYYTSSFSLKAFFVLFVSRLCREDFKNVKTVIGLGTILRKLKYCENNLTELMVHPSYDAKLYRGGRSELKVLVSTILKEKLREKELVVVGFNDV